jgi:broad specificity phosphatase PhoE
LTPRGVLQAEALAQRLSLLNIDALYSSDLGRAVRTGAIIAERCRASANIDPRLRERNLGVLQGLTVAEMAERYPNERLAHEQTGFLPASSSPCSACPPATADASERTTRVSTLSIRALAVEVEHLERCEPPEWH